MKFKKTTTGGSYLEHRGLILIFRKEGSRWYGFAAERMGEWGLTFGPTDRCDLFEIRRRSRKAAAEYLIEWIDFEAKASESFREYLEWLEMVSEEQDAAYNSLLAS